MIKFSKMHGCGNDYIYINGMDNEVPIDEKPEFVKKVSDRHFGIGSDGVIFINSSEVADFEMEMWNSDGTRAQMCGNGIRCVAKYVYDKGLTTEKKISIVSAGAIKYLDLNIEDGKMVSCKVDMGAPILEPTKIPVVSKNERVIAEDILVNNQNYKVTCVSMGNPHAVVFMEDVDIMKDFKIDEIGPFFENHKVFPERTNTEFVNIIDRRHVKMRVWERGAGETLACGTGCCATVVAAILNGLTENEVDVEVLGGVIHIKWDRDLDKIFMTGPATFVFDGEI